MRAPGTGIGLAVWAIAAMLATTWSGHPAATIVVASFVLLAPGWALVRSFTLDGAADSGFLMIAGALAALVSSSVITLAIGEFDLATMVIVLAGEVLATWAAGETAARPSGRAVSVR